MKSPLPTRIPVDSSMLAAVAYDAEQETLFAEFHTGKIWAYLKVSPDTFEQLLQSQSVGGFMRSCIMGCYPEYPVRRGRDFKW